MLAHFCPDLEAISNYNSETFHCLDCESRVGLHSSQLELKVHWNVTAQVQSLGLTLSHWDRVKVHIARKAGGAHHRKCMNGNQNILLILNKNDRNAGLLRNCITRANPRNC